MGIVPKHKGSWPRGVVIAGKKPTLVVKVCASPPFVASNAIAGRGQEENILNRIVVHLNRLKFVRIFDKRQGVVCFCCENSIQIEADGVSYVKAIDGYQSYQMNRLK